jgi:hypothetical protein
MERAGTILKFTFRPGLDRDGTIWNELERFCNRVLAAGLSAWRSVRFAKADLTGRVPLGWASV